MAHNLYQQVNRGSGTPAEYIMRSKIADGSVDEADINAENDALNNKRMKSDFFSKFTGAVKQRVIQKAKGQLTAEEKAQYALDKARAKKGRSQFRSAPYGSELRSGAGGTGQNPLIQVGRQAPNPFLVNRPFTGQGFRNQSNLRTRNYPIFTRPSGYDKYIKGRV